jgi:hypothetical protein
MKKFYFILLVISNIAFSQSYEILFNVQTASGWYGGDDRPGSQRNVADAQSVTIDEPINLESYSVFFTSSFDFVQNPTGTGHEVTLRLHIRDSVGNVLQTKDLVLADTFSGGWATWSAINLNINASGKYIFSHYLVGGFDSLQVSSGISCDVNAGYSGGERYGKYVINDSDAVSWDNWSNHPWDANFWLTGALLPTDVESEMTLPTEFNLSQNYPNPFNPGTTIKFSIPISSFVTLEIFNAIGEGIGVLVSEELNAGNYNYKWNALNLSSGIYFYRLQVGSFVETMKMMLLK